MPKQSNTRRKNNKAEEKRYLDQLQRESWNLELIISGLAIFGLVAANQYFNEVGYVTKFISGSYVGGALVGGMVVAYFSGAIVFANLLIHFLLRGLWIGAIGLRSVSGDINFYKLRLSRSFNRFLRRRIKSFDDYVIGLDRICSVIFSFSFLLVLLLIGFFFYWGVLLLLIFGLRQLVELIGLDSFTFLPGMLTLVYLLLGMVYLLDFLTLGWVKRLRWLGKIYYPFYRFFGFITLARLYRPLYYNFIDDTFGRRMVLLAVPYILILLSVISLRFQGGAFYDRSYFLDQDTAMGKYSSEAYYENLSGGLDEENVPGRYLLASDVVYKPINKLSIYVLPEYTETIVFLHPEAKKLNESVINSELVIGYNVGKRATREEALTGTDEYIRYFKEIFEIRLNGRELSMEDAVLFDSKGYPFPKLVKYLPLNEETPGPQQLEITRFEYSSNGDSLRPVRKILPFYYQPD